MLARPNATASVVPCRDERGRFGAEFSPVRDHAAGVPRRGPVAPRRGSSPTDRACAGARLAGIRRSRSLRARLTFNLANGHGLFGNPGRAFAHIPPIDSVRIQQRKPPGPAAVLIAVPVDPCPQAVDQQVLDTDDHHPEPVDLYLGSRRILSRPAGARAPRRADRDRPDTSICLPSRTRAPRMRHRLPARPGAPGPCPWSHSLRRCRTPAPRRPREWARCRAPIAPVSGAQARPGAGVGDPVHRADVRAPFRGRNAPLPEYRVRARHVRGWRPPAARVRAYVPAAHRRCRTMHAAQDLRPRYRPLTNFYNSARSDRMRCPRAARTADPSSPSSGRRQGVTIILPANRRASDQ